MVSVAQPGRSHSRTSSLMNHGRLACKAFDAVFQRRQTRHRALLAWLRSSLAAVRPSGSAERCMLEGAISWRAAPAEQLEG